MTIKRLNKKLQKLKNPLGDIELLQLGREWGREARFRFAGGLLPLPIPYGFLVCEKHHPKRRKENG